MMNNKSPLQPAAAERGFVRDSNGASLIATIFVLVILSLLGAALCALIAVKARSGAMELQAKQALCAIESGIEYGLWSMIDDPAFAPDPATEYSLPGGTFTMERIDNGDGTETLRVTGYVPDIANVVTKRIVEITGTLAVPQHEFYKYGLWFDYLPDDLDYGSYSFKVTGSPTAADMYASDDIVFANGEKKQIEGTVRSTGTVSRAASWKKGDPWKYKEDGVGAISPPMLDADARTWYQENSDQEGIGPYTAPNPLELGSGELWYNDGTVSIGNVIVYGYGTIVATGDITITGTITYGKLTGKTQGPLALVSFGDIYCNQSTALAASLYANNKFIVGTQNCILNILGNIGTKGGFTLASGTAVNIAYDNRLGEGIVSGDSLPSAPSSAYTWREVYKTP